MCAKQLDPNSITIAADPEADFKALVELMRDSNPIKEEEGEEGENENNWYTTYDNHHQWQAHLFEIYRAYVFAQC